MTIISLLLVLLVERVTTKSRYWQFEFYFNHLFSSLTTKQNADSTNNYGGLALILVPPIVVFVLVQYLAAGLIAFIISTAILMVCVGCPAVRATYKCYLQAANRGDLEACSLYAEQLSNDDEGMESFGRNLVWQNYLHYAAVILWFTALGAAGALLYVLAREVNKQLQSTQQLGASVTQQVMHILDRLPVRITALGFLLVGHFSRAFPTWLSYVLNPHISAKNLLLDVARQAEEIELDKNDCTEEPCTLVRLAKRNVKFILVAIALLTLTGWIN
ncbi:MAG: beta-lactamase regulator AmpE [Paraglaciecola sp.]|nr:beta-lactamase regulator AmpE [Paraglaciecola sp.]